MITGYNTDIKHEDKVYHVQTEDKGLDNPYIESLIYVGGEILASKKTSYTEMVVAQGVDEKAISEMMETQHRKMIAAIKRGRFDELYKKKEAPAAAAGGTRVPVPGRAAAGSAVAAEPVPGLGLDEMLAGATIGAGATIDAAAAMPAGKMPKESSDRTLDQVIIDYLASEAQTEHLELHLLTHPEFFTGQNVELRLQALTTLTQTPVIGAEVTVKLISTVDKAQQVFKGKTTGDGLLQMRFDIPDYQEGNAAVIITATSPYGSDEVKQLVKRRR